MQKDYLFYSKIHLLRTNVCITLRMNLHGGDFSKQINSQKQTNPICKKIESERQSYKTTRRRGSGKKAKKPSMLGLLFEARGKPSPQNPFKNLQYDPVAKRVIKIKNKINST
jgi:hypothetical protein